MTICPGSPPAGSTPEQLPELPGDVWVGFVICNRELLQVRPGTRLQAGDDVMVQTEPASHPQLVAMFETPGPSEPAPPEALNQP